MLAPAGGTYRVNTTDPVADHPLNRGLVSWWLGLPGQVGPNALDLTVRDHLVFGSGVFAPPDWVASPPGFGGLDFNGTTGYCYAADVAAVQFGTGDFAAAGWIEPHVVSYGAAAQGTLVSKDYTGFEIYIYQGQLGAYVGGAANGVAPSSSLSIGRWYHWCLSRIGSSLVLYLDGVSIGSATNSADASNAGTVVHFGTRPANPASWYDGKQSDLRLYNRGLSATEAWGLYEEGVRGNPTVLRRHPDRRAVLLSGTGGAATYTGSAALTAGAATAAGSATFTAPVYTGSAAVSAGPATLSGSATHTPPTYTASGALAAGAATLAGAAVYSSSVSVGSAALTAGAATAAGSATFTAPVYTASGALATAPANLSGLATFTAPVYTASGTLSAGPATLSGSASFAASISSGSAPLSAGAATLAGLATYTSAPAAPSPGGTFRRHGDLSRAFRSHTDPSRVFRSYYPR